VRNLVLSVFESIRIDILNRFCGNSCEHCEIGCEGVLDSVFVSLWGF